MDIYQVGGIAAADQGMTDLYRLDLTPADGSLGYGTAMHPSLRQHTKMAEELTAYLRQIMNW